MISVNLCCNVNDVIRALETYLLYVFLVLHYLAWKHAVTQGKQENIATSREVPA